MFANKKTIRKTKLIPFLKFEIRTFKTFYEKSGKLQFASAGNYKTAGNYKLIPLMSMIELQPIM